MVAGRAVAEDAEIVYPADCAVPAGPAVTFDPSAARAWLTGTDAAGGTTSAHAAGCAIDPDATYDVTTRRPTNQSDHEYRGLHPALRRSLHQGPPGRGRPTRRAGDHRAP